MKIFLYWLYLLIIAFVVSFAASQKLHRLDSSYHKLNNRSDFRYDRRINSNLDGFPVYIPEDRMGTLSMNTFPTVGKGDSILAYSAFERKDTVRLIVKFKSEPLSSAMGLNEEQRFPKVQSALTSIQDEHIQFKSDIARIDASHRSSINTKDGLRESIINFEFITAFNGVVVTTNRRKLEDVKNLTYVLGVWEDNRVEALDYTSNSVIGAPTFWSGYNMHGEDVDIGIIDTGIDYFHEALGGAPFPNSKVVGGYDFVNNDADPMDDDGHGTYVAGIAAGDGTTHPDLRGVAYKARLWSFKVLNNEGWGYRSWVIAGIERALDPDGDPLTPTPIEVLNLSLGGYGNPDDPLSQAVNNATSSGVICVVAAGNEGPSYQTISSPGCAISALTVGATYNNDSIASFSSRGPSQKRFTIKPNVVAPGVNISSAKLGGGYISGSGTSAATPHVAGAVALLRQLYPTWTPEEIKAALMTSAKDIGKDVWTQGSGRISIPKAAARKVIISPASVHFGIDDMENGTWVREEDLIVRNYGTTNATFNFSAEFSSMPGVSVTFNPSRLTVAPNNIGSVRVMLSVNNNVLDYNEPERYTGTIVARSTKTSNTARIPFGFVKARMIRMVTDEIPWWIAIHLHGRVFYYVYDYDFAVKDDTINYVRSPGTYEIWGAYHDVKTKILKEDVVVDGITFVHLKKSDSKNRLVFRRLDRSGNVVHFNGRDGGWEQVLQDQNDPNRFSFSLCVAPLGWFGVPDENLDTLYLPDVSPKYRFDMKFMVPSYQGNYYEFPYTIENGITSSVTLQNNPYDFKRIDYKFPPRTGAFNIIPRIPRRNNYNDPIIPAPEIWTGYYLPSPSPNFSLKYSWFNYFNDSFWSFSDNMTVDSNKIVHFIKAGSSTSHFSWAKETTVVKIGYGAPCFIGKSRVCLDVSLSPYPAIYIKAINATPFFVGPIWNISDLITTKIFKNDTLLLSYETGDWGFAFKPISWIPAKYRYEATYDKYRIADRQGTASVRLDFSTAEQDSNPPYIENMLILSNGIPSDEFSSLDTNIIVFTLGDDKGIDSARIYFKQLGGETWTESNLKQEGNKYSITNLLKVMDGYTSMRLRVVDHSGNSLDYKIEPAFLYHCNEPSIPLLSTPQNDVTEQPFVVTLRWNESSCTQYYQLQVALDSIFDNCIINDSSLTDNEKKIRSLIKDNKYYWRVRACDLTQKSDYSDIWSFTTTPDSTFAISVNDSWNLVSAPFKTNNWEKSFIFPIAVSPAFSYDGSYQIQDILKNGFGYWLKFKSYDTTYVPGKSIYSDTLSVKAGWNMIGSISVPVSVNSIITEPEGIIHSQFFGYNSNGYESIDTLEPGRGYWVKLSQNGKIILQNGIGNILKQQHFEILSSSNIITITDAVGRSQKLYFVTKPFEGSKYPSQGLSLELPPPPPDGTFDVRFASGCMLETIEPKTNKEYPIIISSAEYPVTVQWELKDVVHAASLIVDGRAINMNQSGADEIHNPQSEIQLRLSPTLVSSLPKTFALAQNYPNPFNPITRFDYSLPEDAHVTLKIYNVLGQLVATVVDEFQILGYKSIEWNANGLTSGVYFYRFDAFSTESENKKFVQIKKMLILK